MRKIIFVLLVCANFIFADEVAVTIYNDKFALIKNIREINLNSGITEYKFSNVAATIEPTSVRFISIDNPKTKIVEQNFEFDLVNSTKLLNKYVDKEIELLTLKDELIVGTLLKAEGNQLIVKTSEGLKIISSKQISAIKLAKLPKNLLTRPTLVCQIFSPVSGKQKVKLDYIARDISWQANYNAVLSADDKMIDLTGWVTLTNNSGADFNDAKITLIAGKLNRAERNRRLSYGVEYLRSISKLKPSSKKGKEISESFGEYKLYRLPKRTTLKNNQIKQIKLIQANKISVKKIYLYDGAKVRFYPYYRYFSSSFGRECNTKVNVILSIENRADNNLGIALPVGLVRIFKRDKDGSLEFVGEDKTPSTSADEKLLLYIGDAFDITGKRAQTDFKRITNRMIEEAFKITLKNHKEESVTVTVIEKLYRWSNWEIIKSSDKYKRINSRTIKFEIPLSANSKHTITYRVRYQW